MNDEDPLVSVDARTVTGEFTGIGRYAVNIVQRLINGESYRSDRCRYLVFGTKTGDEYFGALSDRHRFDRATPPVPDHPRSDWWLHVTLPRRLVAEGARVHFSCANYLPVFRTSARSIVTIHDMVPFRHPESDPLRFVMFLRSMIRRACHVADLILTVSEFTRREVIEILDVDPARVRTILNGPSPAFGIDQNVEEPSLMAQLPRIVVQGQPYLLSAGVHIARKNFPDLISAFSRLVKDGIPHHLILVGPEGPDTARMRDRIEKGGVGDRIHLVPYAPDRVLDALYRRSEGFVYPSLYEGFGLPLLEAFACGVPVLASNLSALPEIAGDAAHLVDPRSQDSLIEGMRRLVDDESLRCRLVDAGRERLSRFSWNRAASETRDLIGELL